jgi:hypothetical protein
MPTGANGERLTDGQLGWRQGVFSDSPRTKVVRYDTEAARTGATPPLIDGVPQGGVSWAINCSMRGGGIGQRLTMQPLVQGQNWSGLYQGGMVYQPDATDPILILAIGGQIYRVRVDTDNSVTNLTAAYGQHPPTRSSASSAKPRCSAIQIGDFHQPALLRFRRSGPSQ